MYPSAKPLPTQIIIAFLFFAFVVMQPHFFFEFAGEYLLIVNLYKRSKTFENAKDTQIRISDTSLSSPGAYKGRRGTYTQTHIEGPGLCRGGSDRIPTHVCGEGGSGVRQGEQEWWEGDRRERENLEKQGGGERQEDGRRERDGTCKATQLPLTELALQVHQERTQVVFVCLFVQ